MPLVGHKDGRKCGLQDVLLMEEFWNLEQAKEMDSRGFFHGRAAPRLPCFLMLVDLILEIGFADVIQQSKIRTTAPDGAATATAMGQVDGARKEQPKSQREQPKPQRKQHKSQKEQSDELKQVQNDNSSKQQREQQEEKDTRQEQDSTRSAQQSNTQQKDGTQPFSFSLPDRVKPWKSSPLKDPSTWDASLQALTTTISHFDYPAAIFWGYELVLLYNEAWIETGGIREQGEPQRGSLSPDAWSALNKCVTGGKPSRITSHALLRESEKPAKDQYTVLASPLFIADPSEPRGVIAQMIRISPSLSPPQGKSQDKSKGKNEDQGEVTNDNNTSMGDERLDASLQSTRDQQQNHALDSLGMEPSDNTPLDEHPFFHRFAEMLPTGLAILDHKAQAVFVNQHFYQLTTHMGNDRSFKSWPQSIHPDDYERVMGAYQDAFNSQTQLRTEFRALGATHPWRLLLLTPLGDENLKHVSLGEYGGFICSVVDITSEKSAEISQRQNAEEATERKRQQERFIDMVSHEIRNPLSAMVHCVEDIHDAITTKNGDRSLIDVVQISEALETVNLCISHQKNIVDDVLSFSKLDSSMLALSPTPCKPDSYLRKSLNMFSPQFRKHAIVYDYHIDPPYREMQVEWTMADLSRIGQVLINLITNAIKFTTRKQGEKHITVKVSASHDRPSSYPPEVVFFDESKDAPSLRLDATERPEWGFGEPFYILVALTDTGIGISAEGQKILFERFKQATPKTGEIYGGSGLGLNISRKLVQLHGGEIGVASEEGVGATFGFYFRVRRAEAPQAGQTGSATSSTEDGAARAGEASSGEGEDGEEEEEQTEEQTESQAQQHREDAEREKAKPKEGELPLPPGASKRNEKREEGEERQREMKETGEMLQHSTTPSGSGGEGGSGGDERRHVGRGVSHHDRKGEHAGEGVGTGRQRKNDKGGSGKEGGEGLTAAEPDEASANAAPGHSNHGASGSSQSKEQQSDDEQRSNDEPKTTERRSKERQSNGKDIPNRPKVNRTTTSTTQSTSHPPQQKEKQKRRLKQAEVLHVLLVEDNVINQRIVARKLGGKAYFWVSVASNGKEAVDVVRRSLEEGSGKSGGGGDPGGKGKEEGKGRVDIVLMDQEMPVMDGNAAARAIRGLEAERSERSKDTSHSGQGGRVPILGVSANVRQEQLSAMMECGMDGYITKPYRIEEMVGRIGDMLGLDFEARVEGEEGGADGEQDGEGGQEESISRGSRKRDGGDVGGGGGGAGENTESKNGKELAAEVNGDTDGGGDKDEQGKGAEEKADQGSWAEKSAKRSREKEREKEGREQAKRVDQVAGGG